MVHRKRKLQIIAIDGPVASGKTTVATLLSKKLRFTPIYTGIYYRFFSYLREKGLEMNSGDFSYPHLKKGGIKILVEESTLPGKAPFKCILNGEDITPKLFSLEISRQTSQDSANPEVREIVNGWIMKAVRESRGKGIVAEGRDCSTVLFPYADLKVFLIASPEIRLRRFAEMIKKWEPGNPEEELLGKKIWEEMFQRDRRDSSRAFAPLTVPVGENAFLLDTSFLSIEEVVEKILDVWQAIKRGTPG
ncbi:MAG: (d)CMP kinase [bacterium]